MRALLSTWPCLRLRSFPSNPQHQRSYLSSNFSQLWPISKNPFQAENQFAEYSPNFDRRLSRDNGQSRRHSAGQRRGDLSGQSNLKRSKFLWTRIFFKPWMFALPGNCDVRDSSKQKSQIGLQAAKLQHLFYFNIALGSHPYRLLPAVRSPNLSARDPIDQLIAFFEEMARPSSMRRCSPRSMKQEEARSCSRLAQWLGRLILKLKQQHASGFGPPSRFRHACKSVDTKAAGQGFASHSTVFREPASGMRLIS